jgi:hypothetical protein
MFLPSFGLFEYSDEREVYMKPRPLVVPIGSPDGQEPGTPLSGEPLKRYLLAYRQVGRLIGLALDDGVCPGISFTDGALSFLLYPNTIDLNEIVLLGKESPATRASFEKMIQTDWTNEAQAAVLGEIDFAGLKPHGESEHVSKANVAEYVQLSAKRKVFGSIADQMMSIVHGLNEVLPLGHLSFLTPEEIFRMLRGEPQIDRENLRASTMYFPDNMNSDPQIAWLWEIIGGLSEAQMRDFIKFVSGSSYPPIHNFTGHSGDRKWLQVSVEPALKLDQAPLSQTCFVQLRIPRYSTQEIMRERIIFAIENAKSMETK